MEWGRVTKRRLKQQTRLTEPQGKLKILLRFVRCPNRVSDEKAKNDSR